MTGGEAARRVWAFRLLTAVWLALMALAIASVAVGIPYERARLRAAFEPFNLLGLDAQFEHRTLRMNTWDDRGDLASIRAGDLIVSIDGRPAPVVHSQMERRALSSQLAAAPGPIVTVVTRSRDGALRTHRLERSAGHMARVVRETGLSWDLHSDLYYALDALTGVVMIAASALLFSRSRRDRTALLLASIFLLWPMQEGGSAIYLWLDQYWPVALIYPLSGFGLLLTPLIFPSGRFEPRWSRWLVPVIAVWAILNAVSSLRLLQVPAGFLVAALGVLFGVGATALVIRYRRLPPGVQNGSKSAGRSSASPRPYP